MTRSITPIESRHERIVRIANTESHQMKEIAADHISRGMQAAAVGDLNHRCVGSACGSGALGSVGLMRM
jgi:hypothetical protein